MAWMRWPGSSSASWSGMGQRSRGWRTTTASMRRCSRWGAMPRRVVSTSGSSGMKFSSGRPLRRPRSGGLVHCAVSIEAAAEGGMTLAIFDLDNTLLGGDSDHAWGEFMVREGMVDAEQFRRTNDGFYEQYLAGALDPMAHLEFVLEPLTRFDLDELERLHQRFMADLIEPMLLPRAADLLEEHRRAGDTLLIITATNAFVAAPIARRLGVDLVLATEPELLADRYTGRIVGLPCFREGKITRLEQWLEETGESLEGACFYSDSHNDLPLLEHVSRPVAVDPDPELERVARERGWPIISLR